ncbi:MAG TPA: NPCBM/NEW2 domain-containing protein [Planctomycetota bacterium]|nr:NPCBM/NEW2 domain-containing protein [Planctomycetota bacterium]
MSMRAFLWTFLAAAASPAQDLTIAVSRVDGSALAGTVVSLTEDHLELRTQEGVVTVPLRDVIALHGAVPRLGAPVTARLAGGDELHGELRGGDPAGETVTVESRSLGPISVPIDRLQTLVSHRVAGETPATAFVLPAEGNADEALFLPARRGFDTVYGAIHRFTTGGVVFAPEGGTPREYGLDRFAAVAVRPLEESGEGTAGDLQLITRAGDVLALRAARGGKDAAELVDVRGRAFTLPWAEVATLLFAGGDRVFLSDLQPDAVEEASALAGDEPLYPWRRDRNVRGGFLVVGGHTFARGLGVHSRCVLTFTVPDGCVAFAARVGIDDEVLDLPARGDAVVTVLVDGQPIVEDVRVRVGEPSHSIGPLPVRGGSKLTLKVDFGEGLDLGDRVDWLHAVLLRQRPKTGT